jgi:cytochrome c-type biogenesis protein CcmH
MKRIALLSAALLLLSIALLGGVTVGAQDGSPTPTRRAVSDDEVNRVARNLYCPVCENVPLEVCPTDACARWREQVRDLLAQGYTDEQVAQYFVAHFGAKTVGTPTDPTTQFFTVTLPLLLIGLIGVAILFTLLRWRRPSKSQAQSPGARVEPPDDYRAQLEDELRKRY